MEEEKKLPKNIRQMAEKEERVRVYLEDYAYTFIRKLNCTGHVRTGILLGSKMVTENKRCWFVKGAVELEDAQGSTEEENEQKTAITQQVWDNTLSVIQEYFPGCSICGWFISGTEENFPDGEELKKTHRQIFSGENCLMYWKKGDEESFWMEEEDTILHLKGYFVYYEKNNEMQNYMLSRNADQSEDVSDQAALNFRKIMKEKQGGYTSSAYSQNRGGTGSYGYDGDYQNNRNGQSGNGYDDLGGFWGFGPFGFGGYYGGGSNSGYSGGASNMNGKDDTTVHLRAAANYINNGGYDEALNVLSAIQDKDARWYYYSAMANSGKGNQATAMEHARRAVELDPDNMQYRMFYQRMNSGGEWYSGRQQTYQNPAGGMGSWCMKLIFINLMCNCCLGGGGLCCPGRYY